MHGGLGLPTSRSAGLAPACTLLSRFRCHGTRTQQPAHSAQQQFVGGPASRVRGRRGGKGGATSEQSPALADTGRAIVTGHVYMPGGEPLASSLRWGFHGSGKGWHAPLPFPRLRREVQHATDSAPASRCNGPAHQRWPPPPPAARRALPAAPLLQEAERPAWAVAKLEKRAAEVSKFLGKLTSSETLGPDQAGREYVRLAAMPKTAVVHAQVGAAAGGRAGLGGRCSAGCRTHSSI